MSEAAFEATLPLFSFGLISDVQYADIDNRRSFAGATRHYRHALSHLEEAVASWNYRHLPRSCAASSPSAATPSASPSTPPSTPPSAPSSASSASSSLPRLAFAMHLGDLIDGFNPKHQAETALSTVLEVFARLDRVPVYHIIGNHCLYNFPRGELCARLGLPALGYYSFEPHPAWRVLVLDAYDISGLGREQDHPHRTEAEEILNARNPNSDKNSPDGLRGTDRRFVKFNGAVGSEQLRWLRGQLQSASLQHQRAIVCSHVTLCPGAANAICLLWNYQEVLDVLYEFDCVVACFSGHDHDGGFVTDRRGIHHKCMEGVIESGPGENAFSTVDVLADRLVLRGASRVADCTMLFPAHAKGEDEVSENK